MGIFNNDQKVIIQGLAVNGTAVHMKRMVEYGTNVVGAIVHGKGGEKQEGVSLFETVAVAVKETAANTSIVFSLPENVRHDVLEAMAAGIKLIIISSEKVPLQDMVYLINIGSPLGISIVGPSSVGLIKVDKAMLGVIPDHIFQKGRVGIVSKSEILAYEVINMLSKQGIGQSIFIDLGGDAVLGTRYMDVMPLFEADTETDVVLIIGEIGGIGEEAAAVYAKRMTKPVVALVAGATAPIGKQMGHAGAIIQGKRGSYQSKYNALVKAGVQVAHSLDVVPELVNDALDTKSA
jgi:succinyl-CoA synthetase alpha subunit